MSRRKPVSAPAAAPPRLPVHVFYGGAQLFRAEVIRRLGDRALENLNLHAPDAAAFAAVFGLEFTLAATVRDRVAEKLRREPVEDFRVDFEDGYGIRSPQEEDDHARTAGAETARALGLGTLPPCFGIRIKALSAATAPRAARTLELYLSSLVTASGRRLPDGFRVTLPKVDGPAQAAALAKLLAKLERKLKLPSGLIRVELMVEAPGILRAPGALRAAFRAVGARAVGAHFGAYDYLSACGIVSAAQGLSHPACVWARAAMQVQLAGTRLELSDGATTTLPLGPHKAAAGASLSADELGENDLAVKRGWRRHFEDASSSLAAGFFQGWDLHPAQLVSRYAAVYAYFLEAAPSATARLDAFEDAHSRAVRVGAAFDDAATVAGLTNFFRRGRACGALTETESSGAADI